MKASHPAVNADGGLRPDDGTARTAARMRASRGRAPRPRVQREMLVHSTVPMGPPLVHLNPPKEDPVLVSQMSDDELDAHVREVWTNVRPLAERENDQIKVQLVWIRDEDKVVIRVTDGDRPFQPVEVPREKAMDAFMHPFAYMP